METGQAAPLQRPQAAQQPSYDTTIHRNPFLVCANLDLPIPFNLRSFFSSSKDKRKSHHAQQEAPLETIPADQSRWTTDPAGIHTRVWSDEEHRLCTASNDDDTRSISSEQGVHVETLFTRETHETHRQQR